jgi:hypothetical protein
MTRYTGLGRHSGTREAVGDPLEGLVNLFDIGIVLAVAFLIAGLGLTLNDAKHTLQKRTTSTPQHTQTLPSPAGAPTASGHGQPVGTVYRLSNGQLVYVQKRR